MISGFPAEMFMVTFDTEGEVLHLIPVELLACCGLDEKHPPRFVSRGLITNQ